MPSEIYRLSAVADGNYTFTNRRGSFKFHEITLRFDGTPTAGTITVAGRPPGSASFFNIPDAVAHDITQPFYVQYTGTVAEFRITLAGVTGATAIYFTDTSDNLGV